MIRYMKQRDHYSCGPIAIMNSLKWAGVACPYERLEIFRDLCFCWDARGTTHNDFDRAIRIAGDLSGKFTVQRVFAPKLKQITDHLNGGGIIVLDYFRWRTVKNIKKKNRHLFILDEVSPTGKTLYVVNHFAGGSARQVIRRPKFVKKVLRFQRVDPYYKGWFLQRRGT